MFRSLNEKADVRAATLTFSSFDKALIISSESPSQKYSLSTSALSGTNGSTAIDGACSTSVGTVVGAFLPRGRRAVATSPETDFRGAPSSQQKLRESSV